VRESSTLRSLVLLERDVNKDPFRKLDVNEALNYMEENDFCNPHQLIRNERKYDLRMNFFKDIFSKMDVYILNTIESPQESLNRIMGIISE